MVKYQDNTKLLRLNNIFLNVELSVTFCHLLQDNCGIDLIANIIVPKLDINKYVV